MAIDVRRDSEGLERAIGELLERSFAESRVTRSFDDADESSQEGMFGALPPLTLSPGYYKRADYLLWLDKYKEIGLFDGGWMNDEALGLIAVSLARAAFNRNHPPCGICGALQESAFSTSCCKCGTEFMKRSA